MPRETVRMTQRSTARIYARKNQNRDKKGERERERESTFISRFGTDLLKRTSYKNTANLKKYNEIEL